MTKVSSIKNGKKTKKISPPIDIKVRTKKRKKRKDLEQIRQSVLDARQDLRRERRLAGGLKYKGPTNILDKTLRNFADIREENENKTQGIGENKNERILCTRLLHEPTIGIFKKGAKGNEVKRRIDITLSDAAEARLRGDVIRLLNGDDTSPRKIDNNEKKIIQEEKIISKPVKPVHANLKESEKNSNRVLLHRSKWISKDDNFNRRLFEIDDEDEDDDNNEIKDSPCINSLEFSPKASRVDESDTIDEPNDKHKKVKKSNNFTNSLNRWCWSPATCFEEYCSIVCVSTFTKFIDNCTVEDPVEKIRNELLATYKEARIKQKNDDINEEPEVINNFVTPKFSDNSTITCEVVGHHGSYNKVISNSSSTSSLATTVKTDEKINITSVPELKRYFKNLDSKVLSPQNKMVKQIDTRIGRVSLEQPLKIHKNSEEVLTRNNNEKYLKKNIERSNHIQYQEKIYNDRKNEFKKIYLPEISSNIQENKFNNFNEKKNIYDDYVSEYSIEKEYDHQDIPSPSLGWSASHEAKLIQLSPNYTKHIPSILRRSTNNKTVHFNLDLDNHQRKIKNNYFDITENNLTNEFSQSYKHNNIKQQNINNPININFNDTIIPSDIFNKNNNKMDYINENNHEYLYDCKLTNHNNNYEEKKNYNIKNIDNIPVKNNYYTSHNLKPTKKYLCNPDNQLIKRVINNDKKKIYKNHLDNCETEYNDAILRGFKVLSCSEVKRNKANERDKINCHFLSNQPTKYLAVSEDNDKPLVPRRVPIYHNTKKQENINLNDTLNYYDIYKKFNKVLTPPLIKIYPQKHENISFNPELLSNNNNLYDDDDDNDKHLHRYSFDQNHQIKVPDITKKNQHQKRTYEIDNNYVDLHTGQNINTKVNYFAPKNSYEDNLHEVKCYENLCEKKNCHECFQAKLQNTIRKF